MFPSFWIIIDPLVVVTRRAWLVLSEGLGQDGQPNFEGMTVPELRDLARVRGMRGYSKLKKGELIDRLRGAWSSDN